MRCTRKSAEPASDAKLLRAICDVPVTEESYRDYEQLIASTPEKQRPAIQRRLATRARDLLIEDRAKTAWTRKNHTIIRVRIRLDSELADEIYRRLEPTGLTPKLAVLGSALAPHVHSILNYHPRTS